MGVYIKGVEKPKSCGECFVGRRFMCEHVYSFEDCPMVEVPEPHGRLIDADALKRKSQKVATEAWKLRIKATVEVILNQFIDYIGHAPTVIEGSETWRK